jgi:hypothetical protein
VDSGVGFSDLHRLLGYFYGWQHYFFLFVILFLLLYEAALKNL